MMKRKEPGSHYQLELALSHDAAALTDTGAAPDTAADMAAHSMPGRSSDASAEPAAESGTKTQEPRLWRDAGWTARVIKNEEGDGWAVAMTRDGEAEPAFVGPWTMGRDKKSPKPLDATAFAALVKSAYEVRRRHEQQLHAMLHKSVVVAAQAATLTVTLDIVPDEEHAYATLAAYDESGAQLAQVRVAPTFKLSKASAAAWIESGFRRPA